MSPRAKTVTNSVGSFRSTILNTEYHITCFQLNGGSTASPCPVHGKKGTESHRGRVRKRQVMDRRDMWSGLKSDSAPSCCEYSESSAQ